MIYSSDGKEVDATHYHPNGFIASRGKYINQMKEGKWEFFSSFYEGYLISEESYINNKRNGPSFKFYPDSTVFEKVTYVNDKKDGRKIIQTENNFSDRTIQITCLKENSRSGMRTVYRK